MSSFKKTLSLASLTLLICGLNTSEAFAENDLGLEAIIAPHFSKSFGETARNSFGLDFYRVSAGGSLLALYSPGDDYSQYSLAFRLSGFKQFFGEPLSRGFIYGLGLGVTGSSGVDKTLTNTAEKAGFSDLYVNPYLRYLIDINGWIGPYLEVGYEFTAKRLKWSKDYTPLDPPNAGSFLIGFGLAFEAER